MGSAKSSLSYSLIHYLLDMIILSKVKLLVYLLCIMIYIGVTHCVPFYEEGVRVTDFAMTADLSIVNDLLREDNEPSSGL